MGRGLVAVFLVSLELRRLQCDLWLAVRQRLTRHNITDNRSMRDSKLIKAFLAELSNVTNLQASPSQRFGDG